MTEAFHQRLAAMVARTCGNTFGIEQGSEVMRVNAIDGEAKYSLCLRQYHVQPSP